jgi:ketosteroid isomerase-like protein
MSQENVEVIRASNEAWNAGDMDAVREMHDPDVILQAVGDWPEEGPYVGREAVMRQFEQLRETWDLEAAEPIADFIDVGDRVLMRLIWRGQGHGPEASIEASCLYTVRNGNTWPSTSSGTTTKPSKLPGCGSRALSQSPRRDHCQPSPRRDIASAVISRSHYRYATRRGGKNPAPRSRQSAPSPRERSGS